MIILGIDPGIARCGWGLIETKNSELKTKNFGCIETKAILSKEKRLLVIYKEVKNLIEKYKPRVVAIEELFFNTNVKTALTVGEARGVVLLACGKKNIPISVFTPLQVKMAITGYGRAEKTQIGQMVKALLKLKEIPKPDDTTDALAVALTEAFTKKYK